MDSRKILSTIISILLMILFFRFIGLMFRYWYVSLPIILAIYFYFRRKITLLRQNIFGSNSQGGKPEKSDDKVIDAEFTVVDEDENE